jgi:hypothetical protein
MAIADLLDAWFVGASVNAAPAPGVAEPDLGEDVAGGILVRHVLDGDLAEGVVGNMSDKDATCHVLPQVWFRNTWSWGRIDGGTNKPRIKKVGDGHVKLDHQTLGRMHGYWDKNPNLILCENETNNQRVFGKDNENKFVKDGFHRFVCQGENEAVHDKEGTKAAGHYKLSVKAKGSETIWVRFCEEEQSEAFKDCKETFEARKKDADDFYKAVINENLNDDERRVSRQAYANLVWNKQFYNYVVREWLDGDVHASAR